jgi:hypothetical protein
MAARREPEETKMRHHIAFAALLAAGMAAGAAQAQGIGATDIPGQAPGAAGAVMGGGAAAISGGGDNMAIEYSQPGAGAGAGRVFAQVPRLARALNTTTGGIAVEYLEPERATAGAEAWLVGGGDNAEVVHRRPR